MNPLANHYLQKTLKRWKLVFMDSIEKYKEISHVIVVSYIGLEKEKRPLNILYWSNRIVEKDMYGRENLISFYQVDVLRKKSQ